MKLQDVILKAIAKKITWLDAADIAGLSARTIARMRQKYADYGYDGLYDQHGHKRYIHRVPLATAEKVLALYQNSYSDLGVWRFHQKLKTEQGIRLSYSWVKQALYGAGLAAPPAPAKKPLVHRPLAASKPVARRLHFVKSASVR